jgi:putative redox protein
VREQLVFRTGCGKDVHVGRLGVGDPEALDRRVSLDIGNSPESENGARALLTLAEARRLAAALLQQANAGEGGPVDPTTGQVEVSYLGGESYAATRGHTFVAFYAGRYLARHGLNRDGLHVTAKFTTATDRPPRVDVVRLAIQVPAGMPPSREPALLAVASHCTVHNTLCQAPGIVIELT